MRYVGIVIAIIILIGGIVFFSKNLQNDKPFQTKQNTTNPSSPTASQTSNAVSISTGTKPTIPFKLPSEYTIHTFATDLGRARDLQFSPGGTLLVSDPTGRVIALPDKNRDGVADDKIPVLKTGNNPHGLAFFNGKLYVTETTQVVRFNWDENNLSATQDKVLFSLPQNNNHNLRTIVFDDKGTMYVSVGSTCNVCNEQSNLSATVLTADSDGNNLKIFAKGLRNAPFIQFNPNSNELWGTEMGRDNLGDNVPPDEINIIKGNPSTNSGPADYGWPNCYADKVHDSNFDSSNKVSCNNTTSPIFQISAHSAPLGLAFINSPQFPSDWQGDLLVSYHGSWNRSTPTGYKVVHMKVSGNTITSAEDFLTGFLPANVSNGPNSAFGRPVDLTFDQNGNLYLSDDKSGSVYIIQHQ